MCTERKAAAGRAAAAAAGIAGPGKSGGGGLAAGPKTINKPALIPAGLARGDAAAHPAAEPRWLLLANLA